MELDVLSLRVYGNPGNIANAVIQSFNLIVWSHESGFVGYFITMQKYQPRLFLKYV